MAVTGFVFGMILLCVPGVVLGVAGVVLLIVLRKLYRERKLLLLIPILLLIAGLLCVGIPGGYFAAVSRARVGREQARGALVTAIEKNASDVEAVRGLLNSGIDPDEGTKSGYTPLMAASFRQGTEVMRLLIQAGADVNLQDSSGRSALMQACSPPADRLPDPAGIQLLLQSGADRTLQDNNGRTAYDILMLRAEEDRETLRAQPQRLAACKEILAAVKPESNQSGKNSGHQ